MSVQQVKTSDVTVWERFHAKMTRCNMSHTDSVYFHTIDDF